MGTLIAMAGAPRTPMGLRPTPALPEPAPATLMAKGQVTPTSTEAAPRTPTVGARPTPTPTVGRHRGLTGPVWHIPHHTERQPTPLRIVHLRPTMATIRPPPSVTTRPGATT